MMGSQSWRTYVGETKRSQVLFVSCEDSAADQRSYFPDRKLLWSPHSAQPWPQLPFLAAHCHHQLKSSPPPSNSSSCCLPSLHMAPARLESTYKASSFCKPTQQQLLPNTTESPMAGARRSEQSLAVAGSTRVPGRPQRRRPQCPLYAELAALLPGDLSRANQVEILDAAVAHLKVLADTAAVLEVYRALQRDAGPVRPAAVEVASWESVCIAVRLPPPVAARPGALTRLLEVFDRRAVEVLAVAVTRDGRAAAADVTVTTAAAAPEVVELIKAEIVGIK